MILSENILKLLIDLVEYYLDYIEYILVRSFHVVFWHLKANNGFHVFLVYLCQNFIFYIIFFYFSFLYLFFENKVLYIGLAVNYGVVIYRV